ncbi:MAG: DNA mismatch endonuclease Vsr, partial [Armatimonadetes bacterium]|nr:DNA mismatch endonuclease Vsr [Armatimonadota bacterium]
MQRTEREIADIMRRVKSRDTAPEVAFRKALWARGIRYRLHDSGLPGKPDIVIPSARLVIFVDGDYWHGNQWRLRGHASLADQFVASPRAEYWVGKISGNMRRDLCSTAQLLREGWRAMRLWESAIAENVHECVELTVRTIEGYSKTTAASRVPEHTVAEFFAGIGLMRLALDYAGWRTVFANDIDPLKYAMYRANFPDCADHFRLGDIHSLTADDVPEVTLATASFPCNDLSLAGGMKGLAGKHSGALWGFVRILNEMGPRRPPMVLLENVTGWLNSRSGKDFADSLIALNDLGYECDAFILNASNFVPQSRPRLFVVGLADDLLDHGRVRELQAIYTTPLRPRRLADFISNHPEVRWNIRRLPSPPARDKALQEVLESIPHESAEWWSRKRAEYFLGQMSDRHGRIAAEMIHGDEYTYGTAFRRVRHGKSMAELRVDGVAGCLRTP